MYIVFWAYISLVLKHFTVQKLLFWGFYWYFSVTNSVNTVLMFFWSLVFILKFILTKLPPSWWSVTRDVIAAFAMKCVDYYPAHYNHRPLSSVLIVLLRFLFFLFHSSFKSYIRLSLRAFSHFIWLIICSFLGKQNQLLHFSQFRHFNCSKAVIKTCFIKVDALEFSLFWPIFSNSHNI